MAEDMEVMPATGKSGVDKERDTVSVQAAAEVLTDVLVAYNVPTSRIVAEFRKLLADPVYADA